MEDRPNYYAIIPAQIRYDERLKPNEKLLYGEITALSNKTGECYATNKYFASLYDVTVETISRWITHLKELNYIDSKIIYRDGTHEIDKRIILINGVPIDKKINTYIPKDQGGIDKKIKENNTSINNIYNPSHIAKTLFEEIENNFGRTLSPYEVEEIGKWEDTELTRYAIKKAVLNNKFSIQYISRILYQWKMQNIRTVQEAQLQDEDFQKRKDKRKSTYKHEEIVPQWLNEEQTTEPVSESEQKEIEEVFKSLEREINED